MPESAAGAVLFAGHLDLVAAFKPLSFVSSLADVRERAGTLGGMMEPTEKEWSFDGTTVLTPSIPKAMSSVSGATFHGELIASARVPLRFPL